MTLLPVVLALGVTGPTAAPARAPAIQVAAAEPALAVAAPAKDVRRVGLCVQIDAAGPRVSAARIAAPSGDMAWDAEMLREVVGMAAPASVKRTQGAWMPLWISEPGPEADASVAASPDAADLDCRRSAADMIRRAPGA